MRISDWSSDVCSSDLLLGIMRFRPLWLHQIAAQEIVDRRQAGGDRMPPGDALLRRKAQAGEPGCFRVHAELGVDQDVRCIVAQPSQRPLEIPGQVDEVVATAGQLLGEVVLPLAEMVSGDVEARPRSEEHTSELQSLMR